MSGRPRITVVGEIPVLITEEPRISDSKEFNRVDPEIAAMIWYPR